MAKKLSIKQASIYGLAVLVLGAFVSGILIYIFINKSVKLNDDLGVYNRTYETLISYKFHTENLLKTHALQQDREEWLQSKLDFSTNFHNPLIKNVINDKNTSDFWIVIDRESETINCLLDSPTFRFCSILCG